MADFVEHKNEGVWKHFLREKGGQSAQCKLCKTKLKSVGAQLKASMSILWPHVKPGQPMTYVITETKSLEWGPSVTETAILTDSNELRGASA